MGLMGSLLEQQYIGCVMLGYPHDAIRTEAPVDTDGTVNVVGHDA